MEAKGFCFAETYGRLFNFNSLDSNDEVMHILIYLGLA
jgi:hypothetical protein